MTVIDPKVRTEIGVQKQTELLGKTAPEPTTLLEASWRDYVFAEVWTRPGLDRRSRFLISISAATCAGALPETLDGYIRGALTLGELTLTELREATLQLAVYASWGVGTILDKAITRVANELGLPPVTIPPIQAASWEKQQRLDVGAASFKEVMVFPSPPPVTPYFEGGILNFVFAEMWNRPGLDQRGRRWITLVGVAHSSAGTPIRTHTHAAMASGNTTLAEMQEFVLQFAIDGGWPKASFMQGVIFEMGKRVAEGLPYE